MEPQEPIYLGSWRLGARKF